jgi:hypothetical protein
MKVAGFTFIKDAVKYDYPVVEAIQSILPVCDLFIVAVGNSADDTLNLIRNIGDPKIQLLETVWDETKREGGRVLALETDKAFQAIPDDYDWAFYIQGDEAVHEQYLDTIRKSMELYNDHRYVDGLLFHYKHFYGSYDYVGSSSKWYKNEIRVIRNNKSFYSYRDAQGFRKNENEKLNVIPVDAYVYHYGWVKEPKAMQDKQLNFNKYWHDDAWIEQNIVKASEFDYSRIDELELFTGTHPQVMKKRIQAKNWTFDFDLSKKNTSAKERMKKLLKKYLRLDFSYKNYKIVNVKC